MKVSNPVSRVPDVQSILVIEHEGPGAPFYLPLFANGTPTLLFSTARLTIGNQQSHLFLFGQTIRPEQLKIEGSTTLVAYFLQPYVLGTLFKLNAADLTDQPQSFELIDGNETLIEQLLNEPTTAEILTLLDQYLSTVSILPDQRLAYAASRIAKNPAPAILTHLQHELGLTERTFQRLFETHAGISPNQYRRINQFNNAFRQLHTFSSPDFSAIAYHNGYADQSHFIRSFREFTNLVPSAYLQLARPSK